jgi:hypothetical protein
MRPDERERVWWNEAWQVFESESLRVARRFDSEFAEPLSTVRLRLYVEPTRVHVAGNFLVQFEREARRALSLPIGERTIVSFLSRLEARPRPESPRRAGLEITNTRPGSLEWVLAPYGALEALTTYAPFQVVTAVTWLIGSGATIRALYRRFRDDPNPAVHEFGVVALPDGTRVSVPAGGRLTVLGEGPDRLIELDVSFGEQ